MSQPLLSVLICSLPERQALLHRLMERLMPQQTQEVDIQFDARTGISIGAKRQALLTCALGRYVAFVDDDDLVSEKYVELIIEAITKGGGVGPDCIGITGRIFFQDVDSSERFIHSIACAGWYQGLDGTYFRTPNHLNPVLREKALLVGFNDSSFGEDHDYSRRIRPLLQTEQMIEDDIYFYLTKLNKERSNEVA